MKVLFIISSLEGGGKERQAIELIKGLLDKNIECELILLKNIIIYSSIFDLDCKLHILDKKQTNKLKLIINLYKIIQKSQSDIVQSWDLQSSVFMAPITKLLGVPFVNYSIQYAKKINFFTRFNLLSIFTFSLSDIVVANSKAGLLAHNLKISNKYKCIYNGYDMNRTIIKSNIIKTKLGIKTKYIIGMVGNFLDAKDYKTFITSTQNLLRTRDDISMVMIGNGNMIDDLKNLIIQMNKKHYYFIENITNVEDYIDMFDIQCLICNTNGHAEGISNAIIEGMAMSKPIIATDSGGNKELVLHNTTGFIIKAFDIDELSTKLNFLLNNKKRRMEFSKNGKNRVIKDFSLESLTNQFYSLYIGLLK